MKRITVAMLKRMGACSDEVDTFTREWPRGCAPTEQNILRALDLGLNVYWFADRALTAPAWTEYEKATDSALAEYDKAKDSAWAEYEKAKDSAWAEYEKATDSAWAEYNKTIDSALAELLSDPKNWKGA